jgi:hypothetical protein
MKTQELINFLQKHVDLNPHMADTPILNGITYTEITGYGIGRDGLSLTSDFYGFEHTDYSKWAFFENIFNLAGIKVLNHWELANEYWPKGYLETVASNPWWLVQTELGLVKIGWRKRVINIDWSATPLRTTITEDDVTKSATMVHAWNEEKAVEYLKTFSTFFPGKGTPNSIVANHLVEVQKELSSLTQFVETYLSTDWKKAEQTV